MEQTKDPWWVYPIIAACLASPIVGIGMAYTTGNSWWMWLCLPAVIVLS